ncbi:MAG TPA: class I SAM-dependent methyltransferase [Candidatus Dojkabacteria bacterium]|nr:class I SAM-dependent methyltransferase [Candidatus Dojkabacteria bacterium]
MRVLIACEFSGVVSQAFRDRGHNAISCDLLENMQTGRLFHHTGDVIQFLKDTPNEWDLIIAHPPCTYLSVSGNRYYADRPDLYIPAAEFAESFFKYAERVAVENPVGRLSTLWRKPDQYIQPYQFGHRETKKTGLWLKNLPLLQPTNIVEGPYEQRIWKMGPSKDRGYLRSITYQGIADAMADQWGSLKID